MDSEEAECDPEKRTYYEGGGSPMPWPYIAILECDYEYGESEPNADEESLPPQRPAVDMP